MRAFRARKTTVSHADSPVPVKARSGNTLTGRMCPPGDKSISHRALILGLLAIGETKVRGLLEGDDVLRTAAACRALGAQVTREADGAWRIAGAGIGGLHQPEQVLDFGNAGTGSRLMMGVAGSHPVTVTFDGDASLRKRPMGRILDPLTRMGVTVVDQAEGGRVPLTLKGPRETIPIRYETPVPSAQIKSAVLLAGLNAPGTVTVVENQASRDHTERMLRLFGAQVSVEPHGEAGRLITLAGQPELRGVELTVPADPSSAAFPIVAALITPGSDIVVESVMTNPLRTGLITTLMEMGADITLTNERENGGEVVADLRVRHSALRGVEVPPERAPAMIDEYPVLAVAAAFAEGETQMRGLHELRVKESDRLQAVSDGLAAAGVAHRIEGDDLIVCGDGSAPPGGMAVDDGAMIATSFPDFVPAMRRLGAEILEG